ncbi:hypothetical protein [Microbacterium memoriense]|uniref:Uncharacterized protein n=1 Tax=Microbacterium memoriense TaxID=2978350 RepID=A0ABT2P8U4_9MICO|nr:hypothetical protein [Microbacterium memoriense]MCT9001065.1 hypothetical protein [Microbacterium memoriense]
MGADIELVSDGDGIAVIGDPNDVERFFLHSGLDRAPSKGLDLHKMWSASGTAGAAVQIGADIASNSGRWVKLTTESAEAVRKYGLMATSTPGVSHAMVGQRGDIKQWLQIAQAPSMLLSGPFALTALSTMMQQRAMQEQMDEIVEYLEIINEKVDDILRGQKDAVLADMIGVDLIVEDALTVRHEVGRVSEVTWSKVQATSQTLARTQAYALRELDAIAEKLQRKAGLGDIARATNDAGPRVLEWLAVLARTFQLQDGVSVLELDRVLDSSPSELDAHRLGLVKARQSRLARIGSSTAALIAQMEDTVQKANSEVLFNPFDSPSAVRSSNQIAVEVHELRQRLGIEASHDLGQAKRWGEAAGEALERVRSGVVAGAVGAKRLGDQTLDRATQAFRPVDLDGDGIADQPRAAAAAEQARAAMRDAAAGAAGAVSNMFQRKRANAPQANEPESTDPDRADS